MCVNTMQLAYQDNTVTTNTEITFPQKIGSLHTANLSIFKMGRMSTTTDYITGTVPSGGVESLSGCVVTVDELEVDELSLV